MSPAPTARVRRSPICARSWKPQACASTSTPRPIWCGSTNASASARRAAAVLAGDDELRAALKHCEQVNAGEPITIFEIETAAAFCLFAQHAADVVLLEVGLGGRLDATNVIDTPLATRDRAGQHGSHGISRRHADADRRREGRHHQARRAGDLRRAGAGGDGRDRGAGASACARRCMRRDSNGMSMSSAGGWSIRTSAA